MFILLSSSAIRLEFGLYDGTIWGACGGGMAVKGAVAVGGAAAGGAAAGGVAAVGGAGRGVIAKVASRAVYA